LTALLGAGYLAVSVTATDAAGAEEGTDPIVFTFTCDPICDGEEVNYAFGGTATLNDDYNCDDEDGVLPITGETDTITCTPVDDGSVEAPESITITVLSGTGYTIDSPYEAEGIITDNDEPSPPYGGAGMSLTTGSQTVTIGGGDKTIIISPSP
jgi:hypothetical protein